MARNAGFTSIDALVDKLKTTRATELHRKVVDAMTTSETRSFAMSIRSRCCAPTFYRL